MIDNSKDKIKKDSVEGIANFSEYKERNNSDNKSDEPVYRRVKLDGKGVNPDRAEPKSPGSWQNVAHVF